MRVLIVEDERRMAEVLRRGLAEEGHAIDAASNGPDGRARAADARIAHSRHGGRITIDSEAGRGCRARVALPRLEA